MLGVGLMHWTQSNDDSYLKINTCYHLNGQTLDLDRTQILKWKNQTNDPLISTIRVCLIDVIKYMFLTF